MATAQGFRTWAVLAVLLFCTLLTSGVHAHSPVDYVAGDTINFRGHAQSLSARVTVSDQHELISRYLHDDSAWLAAADRQDRSLFNSHFEWQRLSVHNPLNEPVELYLRHREPILVEGQFFILHEDGTSQSWELGTNRPFAERPVNHREYLMPFTLEAGETATILVGYDGRSLSKNTEVIGQHDFWVNGTKVLVGDGMYFGASLLISLLVGILYFTSYNKIYIYCYLITIGNLLFIVSREGYAYQYLWPNWSGAQDEFVMLCLNLSTIGAVLFSLRFLDLKKRKVAWLVFLSRFVLAYNLVVILGILALPSNISADMVILNIFVSMGYYLFVWGYSIYRGTRGDASAAVYSFAWFLYFLPNVLSTAYSLARPLEEIPVWAMSRNGELLFVIVLYSTLLVQYRQERAKNEAAKLQSEAKNRFLTNVSHELRTPLNGVLGSAELLSETDLDTTQRHYSDIITSSGKLLLNLVNDTLDLAKFSEREIALEHVPFHFDRLLAECSSAFLPEMTKKQLPLFIGLEPDVPLRLVGDEYRLRQILFNLLSNAMKFTKAGMVSMSVSAENTHSAQSTITIVVKDTGIGIPQKSIEKIFEPFGQAEASTTRQYGGSGLGLPICRAIVNHMHGEISVNSTPGSGSEFTIRLPMEVDRELEHKRLESLKQLAGKRLLLLSDFEGVYDAHLPSLRHWGIEFEQALDLSAVKSRLKSRDYDGLVAFFTSYSDELLVQLQDLEVPTIIMHHANVSSNSNWKRYMFDLPIPAGLQDIADGLIRLTSQRKETAPTLRRPIKGGETSVLVVEDNATNQMVAVGMLEHLGYKPDVADDGEQACRMARKTNYDLILMDCDLPVMDGYTAARRILARIDRHPPYIAALTADAQEGNLERCKAAGMGQVLHKPLSIQELKAFLEQQKFSGQAAGA